MPRCSTAFFTKWEMEAGDELLEGATVVEAMVEVVVLTTISATFSTTSFSRWLSPTVMLVAGPAWSVLFTTEEVTGTVVFLSTIYTCTNTDTIMN